MNNLSLQELKSLLDSRMVEIENQLEQLKEDLVLLPYDQVIESFYELQHNVEDAREAYEAIEDKELELQAEELEG